MTQYMLAVHDNLDTMEMPPPEVVQAMFAAVDVFNQKIMANGNWVFGGGLAAPSTATVVKVVDGEVLMTDGPFAESKEQLGGFWIIEAPDLDAALALAAEATVACGAP